MSAPKPIFITLNTVISAVIYYNIEMVSNANLALALL
jgi:hypothetical protein